jgi:pyruvate dehydrogenase phosphatase
MFQSLKSIRLARVLGSAGLLSAYSRLNDKTPRSSVVCEEQSTIIATSSTADRICSHTYPANNPIEDRHLVVPQKKFGGWLNGSNWDIAAVFDGHGGWQVAQLAQERLLGEVIKEMEQRLNTSGGGSITSSITDESILTAFSSVEKEYLRRVKEAYRLGFGEVGKVGACALVALYNNTTGELVLGNAGDCRAVLGSIQENDNDNDNKPYYLASRITHDHNARMPLELLTLQKEHPGEDDVVICKTPHACYVKGRLQLTRALGDAYLKYSEFNTNGTHRGRHISGLYTPPYVKSTPDIHHVTLSVRDKFVVLASDGLWDFLSDEDAIKVVGECIKKGEQNKAAEMLVHKALTVAASECGMTLAELKSLPQGSSRRNRHDDTTAVVLFF